MIGIPAESRRSAGVQCTPPNRNGRFGLVSPFWRAFSLVLAFSIAFAVQEVRAGTATWMRPVEIYRSNRQIEIPILLGDKAGRVHVFWAEREFRLDGSIASSTIYYMTKEGDVWTGPFDIVFVRNISVFDLKGLIDDYGRAHLVYKGDLAAVTYVHSRDAYLANAKSWTEPIELSNPSQLNVDIAIDPNQKLHLISTEVESPAAEWVLDASSEQWRGPAYLASPPQLNQGIDLPMLTIDSQGTMHLVWTLVPLPEAYPPLGAYYSRSEDEGASWSPPFELAPPDYTVTDLLLGDGNELHVIFIGRAGVEGRYHRMSRDRGLNWSEAQSLIEGGGGLSGGDLAFDSAGILHAVFGSEGGEMIAYASWDGTRWSAPEDISRGAGDHGEEMEVVMTNGNRLHVIWRDNQEDGEMAIWYVEGRADAPETPGAEFIPLPVENLPASTNTASAPVESMQPAPPLPTSANVGDQGEEIQPVGAPLAVGLAVSTVVIALGVVLQLARRKSRR